ncbi:MAG TPA: CDP-archaeol synthase [Chloroflexota bacterium]
MTELALRFLVAAVGIPLVVASISAGGLWFVALTVVLAVVGTGEVLWLLRRAGCRPLWAPALIAAIAPLADVVVAPGRLLLPLLTVALVLGLVGLLLRAERRDALRDWGVTLAAGLYLGLPLGHGLLLRALDGGAYLLLIVVAAAWAGDTVAYAGGSFFGRHRLAPSLSPRKTVEGAIGGVLAAAVATAVGGLLAPVEIRLAMPWSLAALLGYGALLGVAGVVGDLAESLLKRQVGAKDSSSLIPGHGGLLDRLDSILFCLVVGYWCSTILW